MPTFSLLNPSSSRSCLSASCFTPRIMFESSTGTPVIASRIEPFAELVEDGETGLLFAPGDPYDLADKMMWALTHPEQMIAMGQRARLCYEARYTALRNYEQLVTIYRDAIDEVKKGSA